MRTSLRFIAVCRMMAITIPLILICSLSVIGQDYPDGPYRPDPNGNRPHQDQIDISHIGGGGSRAGTGSIAVNENPTYNAYTPAQLVQNILVKGCLVASDVTFSGLFNTSNENQRQLGYFNKAEATSFPLDEGLILSSGYVVTAEGPNSSGSAGNDLGGAGDADLNALSGYTTHDAAVLEFDFIPAGNTLEFQFIFASDEYLEFCCTQYNDVFGFFLSGPGIPGTVNLAVLPGTTTPITVNQIHSYVADNYYHNSCTAANASYYINNPSGSQVIQYDGYTVTLTATHAVTACSTYHIKMAIADASDHIYDSGVFLKGQSFSSEPVAFLNEVQPYGSSSFTSSDNIYEGCTPNRFHITRTSSAQDLTVHLQYSGTALNGTDVQLVAGGALPSSVLIPAGTSDYIIEYYAVDDGAGDNGETFTVSAKISCPCETPPSYVIKNLHIHEAIVSVEAIPTNVVCNAVTNGTIIVNVTGGSGTFQYSLDGTTWQSGNLFTGLAMGTYTVYVRDVSSCTAPTVVAGVVIGAAEAIDANAGPDKTICNGQSTTLNGSGGVLYSWSPSTGLSATNIPNPVASPVSTTTYTLTVTSSTGQCSDNDQVLVTVLPSPTAAITPLNSTICLGGSVTLTASGGGAYLWNPGGSTAPSITVSPTTNASYTVLVTSPNGCTDTEAASVYVNPAPASFNVTGGGAICAGGSVHVGLSGSVTGTNYQLFKDGSPLGSPVNGTGSALDFGPYSLAGTYTVGATISATSCTATMSGSAVITVDPTSVGGTATPSQTICSGSSPADITLTGNAGNIQWQSSSDNVTFYDIAGATSASLTSAQMGTLTSTTYYHAEVTSGVCSPAYSNTVTVTVIQPPVAPANASVDRNNFCADDAGNIVLSYSGGSGATLNWYAGSCGSGSPIGSGNNLSIASPVTTTTYYARWESTPCSSSGCASVTVTVIQPPVAPANASVDRNNFCADDAGNIVLSYSGGSGAILNWYTGSCGSGSPIGSGNNLSIASPVTTTTYYARWESTPCSSSGCASVTVTVIQPPVAPANASVDRNNFCADDAGNIVLSYSGGSGAILNWYAGSCGSGSPIGSGNNLSIASPVTTTTYYARWESTPCSSSGCASVTVTVIQPPVTPANASVDRNNFCADDAGNIVLSYSGGSGAILNWYAGSCGSGSPIGSGNNLSIASPVTTTTYYARWESTPCSSSGCASVTVTVIQPPVAPANASVDRNNFCADDAGNIVLSYSGGSGAILNWYAGSCGSGSPIGSGNNLSIASPVTTTTYYARWESTPCSSSGCASVTVTVIQPPVAPANASVDRNNFCADDAGNIVLSYSGGSGAILNWYAGDCGSGSPIGSGNNLSIASPVTTTTYYARWESTPCSSSGCASVTVTVIQPPVAPANASVDRNNFCADDAGNIVLSYSGGSGAILNWYAGSCGSGSPIGSGNNLSIASPVTTTTYYARWESTPCSSSGCASVTVTVIQPPVAPANASVDRNNFCADDAGNIVLSYTGGSGAILNWYAGSCGSGSPIGSGNNLSIASPVTTTTYYARWESTPCSSSGCASVTVTVIQPPVAPANASVDRNNFCADDAGNIVLSYSGGSGAILNWYTGSCGSGSPIGSGNNLSIASPVTTTTYYARWESTPCSSSGCASVTVTVIQPPVTPANASVDRNNFCADDAGNIVLSYSGGSGAILNWYTGSCGSGSPIGSGNNLSIASPVTTTTYYARWESTPCSSSGCASVTVTVKTLSAAPASASSSADNFCADAGGTLTLTASGGTLGTGAVAKWYSGSCGGTPVGTGNPLNISKPTITTTYYVRYEGDCNTTGCASVTITVTPNNTVGSPSSTPTLCINTVLTPVTHTTTGATGIGTPAGLPAGVTAGWAANTITISGTPTVSGTFGYSIPLTGGCGTVGATGTITVTPSSALPPSLPDIIGNTSEDGTGNCTKQINLVHPSFPVNACGPVYLAISFTAITPSIAIPAGGALAPGGNNTYNFYTGVTALTYNATDQGGNTSSVTFTVTITDDENPVITCPANIEQFTDPGKDFATVEVGTATAVDNCIYTMNGVRSDGQGLGNPYPIGETTITWTATDGAGRTDVCVQTITVLPSYGVNLTIFLQGPFNTTTEEMDPILKSNGQVPTLQPYNTPPWNYTGTESVATLNNDVVDWILVELRSNLTTVHARKAGLLHADGSASVSFYGLVSGDDNYYVVVRHRNHMPVMSANKIAIPETGAFLDMTTPATCYGSKPMIPLTPSGIYGMIAGEVITDGQLKYSGPDNDRGPILARILALGGSGTLVSSTIDNGYWIEEVNMNNELKYIGANNDRSDAIYNITTLLSTTLLTEIYYSEVPGEWNGLKSQRTSDGPVNIHLAGSQQGIQVVLTTNEPVQNGVLDNLQFTLAWNATDMEMEEIVSSFSSGYLLEQQGDPVQVGDTKYLVFATVTPNYLPQVWNPGEDLTVLNFEPEINGQLLNRLWIADDSFTSLNNAMYYISVWGSDYTGMIEDPVMVSIDEPDPALTIIVYPNPVHNGRITVQMKSTQTQTLIITIFDVSGNLLVNLPWKAFSGLSTTELDLSALIPGAYMLSINGSQLSYKKKIILLSLN